MEWQQCEPSELAASGRRFTQVLTKPKALQLFKYFACMYSDSTGTFSAAELDALSYKRQPEQSMFPRST
eukprot:1155707-Pelagomonas_calceolata.AAC.5